MLEMSSVRRNLPAPPFSYSLLSGGNFPRSHTLSCQAAPNTFPFFSYSLLLGSTSPTPVLILSSVRRHLPPVLILSSVRRRYLHFLTLTPSKCQAALSPFSHSHSFQMSGGAIPILSPSLLPNVRRRYLHFLTVCPSKF